MWISLYIQPGRVSSWLVWLSRRAMHADLASDPGLIVIIQSMPICMSEPQDESRLQTWLILACQCRTAPHPNKLGRHSLEVSRHTLDCGPNRIATPMPPMIYLKVAAISCKGFAPFSSIRGP